MTCFLKDLLFLRRPRPKLETRPRKVMKPFETAGACGKSAALRVFVVRNVGLSPTLESRHPTVDRFPIPSGGNAESLSIQGHPKSKFLAVLCMAVQRRLRF